MDEYEDMRSMMDYVENTESIDESDNAVLTFVDNSIFLSALGHHFHLQCKYFSKHMELDEFYKEFPEYVDSFIEGLMSTRGPLPVGMGTEYSFQPLDQAVSVFESYVDQAKYIHQILENRQEYGSVNTLEDIISFVERIIYKLKYLQ